MKNQPAILIGLLTTIVAGLLATRLSPTLTLVASLALLVLVALLTQRRNLPVGVFLAAVAFAGTALPLLRGFTITDAIIVLLVVVDRHRFLPSLPKKPPSDPVFAGVMVYLLSAMVGDALQGFFAGTELFVDVARWGVNLLYYFHARSLFMRGNRRFLSAVALGFATLALLSAPVSIYETATGRVYDVRALAQPQGNYQLIRGEYGVDVQQIRSAGLFGNANMTGMQMALVLPWVVVGLMASNRKPLVRLFYLVSVFAVVVSAVLTASRTGVIALVIAVSALFVSAREKRRFLKWSLVVMCLLLLGYGVIAQISPIDPVEQVRTRFLQTGSEDFNTVSRIELNTLALRIWSEHPIFGSGMGRFQEQIYQRTDVSPVLQAALLRRGQGIANHNSYTQFLAEAGLVGTVGLLFALIRGLASLQPLVKLRESDPELYSWGAAIGTSILVVLVSALAGDYIPQRSIWFLFGIAGGLSMAVCQARGRLVGDNLEQESNVKAWAS